MKERAEVPTGWVPNPELPKARLGPIARGTLGALVEVVAPPEPKVDDVRNKLVDFVLGFIPYLPPVTRRLFPLGMWLIEFGTWVFLFSPLPFSRMSLERRRQYLQTWLHSRISVRRQLFKGLRSLATMGFYEQPEVKRHLAYDPEPIVQGLVAERRERLMAKGLPVVVEPHDIVERKAQLESSS